MKNLLQGIRSKKNWHLKALLRLVGDPNVGKSNTLIDLSKLLVDESLIYVEEKGTSQSFDRHIFIRTTKWCIGIGTAGDTEDCISKNLAFFKRMKCDIGIMAIRPSLIAFCGKKMSLPNGKCADLVKPDVQSDYERKLVRAECAEVFLKAVRQVTIKEAVSFVKNQVKEVKK